MDSIGVGSLTIVILTWLMAGRLMRPIRELTGAASALAAVTAA